MSPSPEGVLPCREPSAGEASPTADARGGSGMSPSPEGVLPCREPSAGEASPTADARGGSGMSPSPEGVLPCREPSAGEASPTADARGGSGMSPSPEAYFHASQLRSMARRRRAAPSCGRGGRQGWQSRCQRRGRRRDRGWWGSCREWRSLPAARTRHLRPG